MALTLMYITNDVQVAQIAEKCGVDWIFIDLETIGKAQRQARHDTVISHHSLDDVKRLKSRLTQAKVLVRINSIYRGSPSEIRRAVQNGADIIMLPYFKRPDEVKTFIEQVDGRAKTCLLVETPEAVERIDAILDIPGIDCIHIGLNDLHLGYGMTFMFELLSNGTVETLCRKIRAKSIPYGFGGIAKVGQLGLPLPSEYVIAEHYRLGSTMAILSRSFCNTTRAHNLIESEETFRCGIADIRSYERELLNREASFFLENQARVARIVEMIVMEKNQSDGISQAELARV